MKKSIDSGSLETKTKNAEVSCGNCWGHQEYIEGYVDKAIDLTKDHNKNFISKFVRKYIRKL
jgi:hypothetical protein